MLDTFDPKIKTILKALNSKGFKIKGIRQGIRLKLEGGIDVDIYTLKFDTSKLRARLKLPVEDSTERTRIIEEVSDKLRDGLAGTSNAEVFKFSRCVAGNYYYYARLFMPDPESLAEPEEQSAIMIARKGAAETNEFHIDHKGDLQRVVNMLESVDSSMFRKALDNLGIPRTSMLRVALTRIFRAATDLDEFKHVIMEEASRISDPADRSDLDKMLTSNHEEFLEPLVRMLHQSVFDDADMEANIKGY